jgi:hypothetical protein
MLQIDGVRYEEWIPQGPQAEDELEQMVKEHAQDIFGEQSIYLDRKQKLKSLSGIGSIPDGYVIVFGALPEWHIVEVELSSHPLYEHIVTQVSKFINGISNPNIQRGIVNAIYGEITRDDVLRLRLKKAVEPTEIYKFLSDLISKQPILTIIIEKDTEELGEALATLRYPQIKVVEFRTFAREGVGLAVHAHLFEPLYARKEKEEGEPKGGGEMPVTVKDLLDANILKVGWLIFGEHKGKTYEARILHDGKIKLLHDGSEYNSPSMAAFKGIVGHQVNGWKWWHTVTENGKVYRLDDLRRELRATHPPL